MDEEKLLHNLNSGKNDSLEELIRIYTPYVSVVVYNTIGFIAQKEDIEEVIADVFVSLWLHSENINPQKGGIRSYIGAVARNTAKNKLRSITVHEEMDENIESEDDDPEDLFEHKEEKRMLLDLVMSLGEPDSEIFLRYYYYNEKIRTISKLMGINASTVKSKLSRGKEKLKSLILRKGGLGYGE